MRKASSQVQSETSAKCDEPPRDRHGDRGVPPPLAFDIYTLPDSTPLTLRDVAAHGRWAVATVQKWRQQPNHPLKWFTLPGGFVRTTVGAFKAFLALGKPRPSLTPPTARPSEPRKIPKLKPKRARGSSRRRTDDQPEAVVP